jgi:hypothetical protein
MARTKFPLPIENAINMAAFLAFMDWSTRTWTLSTELLRKQWAWRLNLDSILRAGMHDRSHSPSIIIVYQNVRGGGFAQWLASSFRLFIAQVDSVSVMETKLAHFTDGHILVILQQACCIECIIDKISFCRLSNLALVMIHLTMSDGLQRQPVSKPRLTWVSVIFAYI